MTFDSKNRYRNIKDAHADELENIEKIVNSDHWRQKFHIMPKTGLLNDPNGLAHFNGEYHIFYQYLFLCCFILRVIHSIYLRKIIMEVVISGIMKHR